MYPVVRSYDARVHFAVCHALFDSDTVLKDVFDAKDRLLHAGFPSPETE